MRANHALRVASHCRRMAAEINALDVGAFAEVSFTEDQEEELYYAPLRDRLIAVAKAFEALTAPEDERCKPLSPEKAARVLELEAVSGRLDRDVVKLFIRTCLQ
ncbi:MAG: hypothetical protein ACOCZA_04295 [Spirochaetota bacterium]